MLHHPSTWKMEGDKKANINWTLFSIFERNVFTSFHLQQQKRVHPLNSQAFQWTHKLLTIHMAAGLLSHNTLLVIASSSGSIDRWMDWSDRSRCSLSDCPKNPSNGSAVRVHTVNTVLICENSSQYLHGLRWHIAACLLACSRLCLSIKPHRTIRRTATAAAADPRN